MNPRFGTFLVLFGSATFLLAPRAHAQSNDAEENNLQKAMNEVEEFWPASDILKMAVSNLSKRYNLNEEQQAYTDEMMTKRVAKFLEEHREEVWPLLRDLVLQQRKGTPPDPERARELAPTALKIIREAQVEIYRSNEEWRQILTEDQKQLHDWDLAEMKGTFAMMQQNFEAWEAGHPESANIFPPRQKPPNEPRRPTKPKKPGTLHPTPKDDPELDERFDIYVAQFATDYELKPDQLEAARSILREIKGRAAGFRATNAEEIRLVKERINQGKVDQRRIANEELKKLMKPIRDLYVELTDRVGKIPDDGQRERHLLRAKQHSERNAAVSSSKGKRTRPTPNPPAANKSPAASTKDESK